jgi:hypothetical protein
MNQRFDRIYRNTGLQWYIPTNLLLSALLMQSQYCLDTALVQAM